MEYITDTDYMPKYALSDPELCMLFYLPLSSKIYDIDTCGKTIYRLLHNRNSCARNTLSAIWIDELSSAIEKLEKVNDDTHIVFIPFLFFKRDVSFVIKQYKTMLFLFKEMIEKDWSSIDDFGSTFKDMDESQMIVSPESYFRHAVMNLRGIKRYDDFCKKNHILLPTILSAEMEKRRIMGIENDEGHRRPYINYYGIYMSYHKEDIPLLSKEKFMTTYFSGSFCEEEYMSSLTEDGKQMYENYRDETFHKRDFYKECFFDNQTESQKIEESFDGIDIDSGLLSDGKRKTKKSKFKDQTLLDFTTTMYYAIKSFSRKIENENNPKISKDDYFIKKCTYSISRCFIDELDENGNRLFQSKNLDLSRSTIYQNIQNVKNNKEALRYIKRNLENVDLPVDKDLFE